MCPKDPQDVTHQSDCCFMAILLFSSPITPIPFLKFKFQKMFNYIIENFVDPMLTMGDQILCATIYFSAILITKVFIFPEVSVLSLYLCAGKMFLLENNTIDTGEVDVGRRAIQDVPPG